MGRAEMAATEAITGTAATEAIARRDGSNRSNGQAGRQQLLAMAVTTTVAPPARVATKQW